AVALEIWVRRYRGHGADRMKEVRPAFVGAEILPARQAVSLAQKAEHPFRAADRVSLLAGSPAWSVLAAVVDVFGTLAFSIAVAARKRRIQRFGAIGAPTPVAVARVVAVRRRIVGAIDSFCRTAVARGLLRPGAALPELATPGHRPSIRAKQAARHSLDEARVQIRSCPPRACVTDEPRIHQLSCVAMRPAVEHVGRHLRANALDLSRFGEASRHEQRGDTRHTAHSGDPVEAPLHLSHPGGNGGA